MLASKYRLNGPTNFQRVQHEGSMFQSENFGIAFLKRKDADASKFAFIVSTKIAKDAVDRNRFKRAMSEAVRLQMTEVKPGYDVVFLAKTSIVRIPTDVVMKEVSRALRESGISR